MVLQQTNSPYAQNSPTQQNISPQTVYDPNYMQQNINRLTPTQIQVLQYQQQQYQIMQQQQQYKQQLLQQTPTAQIGYHFSPRMVFNSANNQQSRSDSTSPRYDSFEMIKHEWQLEFSNFLI